MIQEDDMTNNTVGSANKETERKKMGKSAQWTLSTVVTSQFLSHTLLFLGNFLSVIVKDTIFFVDTIISLKSVDL